MSTMDKFERIAWGAVLGIIVTAVFCMVGMLIYILYKISTIVAIIIIMGGIAGAIIGYLDVIEI